MINDEINNRAINLEVKVAKLSAKAILEIMKKVIDEANSANQSVAKHIDGKVKTNSKKLKDMVKKGRLENIDLGKGELKELKKQLNKFKEKAKLTKTKDKVRNKHQQKER